jgi:hypothetical protein
LLYSSNTKESIIREWIDGVVVAAVDGDEVEFG